MKKRKTPERRSGRKAREKLRDKERENDGKKWSNREGGG